MDAGKRFEIRKRLGAGASGDVFHAIDRDTGASVALKTLRQVSADALLRFKTEFRALQDLEHPHVVHFGELFQRGEQWFFTMELVEGVGLKDWVAPPTDVDDSIDTLDVHCDERSLRHAVAQLCDALAAIHEAGLVHRDVKPSNVRVTAEGKLLLLDFGLVTETAASEDGAIVGTPLYMAPEQARSMPVGPPADMYAVGVILFEALTGAPPFTGNPFHLLVRKQQLDAPAPRELAPHVPDDLNDLCVALLSRDPSARPDAVQVATRLRQVPVEEARAERPSRPFVGRASELEVLHAASQRDGFRAVLVQGSSGIGKTALVDRFVRERRRANKRALVFRGRCYEHENVPFKGFDALVDDLGRWLRRSSPELVASLLPEDAGLLERMFPVLGQVQAIRMAASPTLRDPLVLRERTFAALILLLARIGERWPLALVLDDAQWMDAEGRMLLAAVQRSAPGLLMVCIARGEEELDPETGALLETVANWRLPLGRLDVGSSVELARVLSDSPHAEAIAERAEGHPLFIAELVRQEQRLDAEIDLESALRARVSELDEGPRKLLAMACLATRPMPVRLTADAAELAPESVSRALKSLRVARLLRARTGSRLEPTHDQVRRAGLAELGAHERRQAHGSLARALEHHEPDAELLAFHYSEAGEGAKASNYAFEAGRHAAEVLAFHRAVTFFRDALRLHPARPWAETRRIHAALGDALANAGLGAEAGEAYMRAVQGASESEARQLRLAAARTFLQSGRIDRGKVVARRVLRDAGMRMPGSAPGALASMLYHRGRVGLRGTRFVARSEAEVPKERLDRVDTIVALSAAVSMVDFIQGADLQARGLRLALDCGERFRVARALANEAATVAVTEPPPMRRGRRLLAQADALAGDLDDPYTRAYIHLSRAAATLAHFAFREALAEARAADALLRAECTGVAWELSTAHHIIGMSLWSLGRYRELAAALPTYLREARERSDLYGSTTITTSGWFAHFIATDAPEAGMDEVRRAMAEWAQPPFQLQHYLELEAMSELEIYAGGGRALERLQRDWGPLRRSLLTTMPSVALVVASCRARAALEVARDDATRRNRLLTLAAKDARRVRGKLPTPVCEGQLDAIEGAVAFARGDGEQGTTLLRRAVERLRSGDMEGFAQAVRFRLGAITDDDAMRDAAAAWLREHGIANPERYSFLRCPGVW